MPIVKISSKGHIILPKAIREALAVEAGDYLEVTAARGVARLMRAQSKAEALAGALRGLARKRLDWKRLRSQVAAQVAEDVAKKL